MQSEQWRLHCSLYIIVKTRKYSRKKKRKGKSNGDERVVLEISAMVSRS
jgi:hypothetical protein